MSALDQARNRRDEMLVVTAAEIADLDSSVYPEHGPIFEAIRAALAQLLKLPRPGCADCDRPATYVHLDDRAAVLACDDWEPGGYHVKLADLVDGDFDWIRQIGEKGWGLIALVRLIGRLEGEEHVRQLRELRAGGESS